jgi:hypothetical protein
MRSRSARLYRCTAVSNVPHNYPELVVENASSKAVETVENWYEMAQKWYGLFPGHC